MGTVNEFATRAVHAGRMTRGPRHFHDRGQFELNSDQNCPRS